MADRRTSTVGVLPSGHVRYERQYRTASSEGYHVIAGDLRLAQLDVHFTATSVYGTLVVLVDMPEDQVLDLIEGIDEAVVLSAEVPRDDFLVTVFRGRQTGLYSDDFLEERRVRRGDPEGRVTRMRRPN
jgi:hypothetical protein